MEWISGKQFIEEQNKKNINISEQTLKAILSSFENQIKELKQQIINIPQSSEYHANRYDTDDEYVLHLWKDNESYDIRIKKKVI